MRILLGGLGLLFTCALAFADHDRDDKARVLPIQTLNSPVKENLAKFRITLPSGMTATRAIYRFEEKEKHDKDNDRDEKHSRGDRNKKGDAHNAEFKLNERAREITLVETPQDVEAQIPVSELPPGAFVIVLEVKASKTWIEKVRGLFQSHEAVDELRGKADFEIDASLEVADPGSAGMTTLAGIDSDGDGVRDDVQRWINENYGSSPNSKSGLRQVAQTFQAELLHVSDKATSIQYTSQYNQAAECLSFVMGGADKAHASKMIMIEKMLNTRDRNLADIKASENYNGQMYTLTDVDKKSSLCKFQITP